MYLDTLATEADPTSPDAQSTVKNQVTQWVENSEDVKGDLDHAFKLWTAVSPKGSLHSFERTNVSLDFCSYQHIRIRAW